MAEGAQARRWDDWLRELILVIVIAPTIIYYCGLALIPAGAVVCIVGAIIGILSLVGLWGAVRRAEATAGRGLFTAILLGAALTPIVMPALFYFGG
jgi:hypothetical protein